VRRLIAAVALTVGAANGGCGGDDAPAPAAAPAKPAGKPVSVELREEAASGQNGTATLTPIDAQSMMVVIEITPSKEHSYQYAHIHEGTCAEYRKLESTSAQEESVTDELQDVRAGRSESTLYTTPLEERTTGRYSINVHLPVEGYKVVACGDIPRRG
jgi:hypothetical protein